MITWDLDLGCYLSGFVAVSPPRQKQEGKNGCNGVEGDGEGQRLVCHHKPTSLILVREKFG